MILLLEKLFKNNIMLMIKTLIHILNTTKFNISIVIIGHRQIYIKNGENIGLIHILTILQHIHGIFFLQVEKRFVLHYFMNYGDIYLRILKYVVNWHLQLNVFMLQV